LSTLFTDQTGSISSHLGSAALDAYVAGIASTLCYLALCQGIFDAWVAGYASAVRPMQWWVDDWHIDPFAFDLLLKQTDPVLD